MTGLTSTPRTSSRAVAVLTRLLRAVVAFGGILLLIATFLPLLHPAWPLASVAEHFAWQILMGAVALGSVAFVLRCWRWLGVVASIALVQIWTIHPYWPGFVAGSQAAQAGPGEMKVVSLNVWVRGTDYRAVRDYLRASGAGVIGLVEVTPRWKAELAPLRAVYPYSVDCIGQDVRCEEMLLSKYPFRRSAASRIDGALPVLVWGEVTPPDGGKPVTFAISHVVWPLLAAVPVELAGNPYRNSLPHGLPRIAQAEQVQNLANGLRTLGPDLILLGDFNAAPWSRVQQALRQATGLDNRGFLAPSWPTFLPAPFRLPIDHILTRGSPRLISFEPGPAVGSDHLPVEAILGFAQP